MKAQNLVPNHSFEEFTDCPSSYTELGEQITTKDWYTPTKGSPDYFHKCSRYNVSVPVNFMGHMFAQDGNAYVGILLAEYPERVKQGKKVFNEREYVQSKLSQKLIKDSLYEVKFHYSIATHSLFQVNSLGVCLSTCKPTGKRVLECTPVAVIDTTLGQLEKARWVSFSDTITALGGEQFITIGNFVDDYSIKYKMLDFGNIRNSVRMTMEENRFAYYWIDNISVIPIKN